MIKKYPLITIIITYYKKKKFIKKTLNSIFQQSYKNFEVIFVYDDIENEDLNYVKNLLNKFKKKKLIINKKNLGVAKARNLAIKHSRGSYLAFIDSDDIWKKNKLKTQLDFMIKGSYLFTFTSYNLINESDKMIGVRKVFFDANYSRLIKSNFIGLSTVMLSKKMFCKVKFPILKTQEDFALWLMLLKKGYKLKHLNKALSSWRMTEDSLSSNKFQKIKDAFTLFYKLENKNFIFSIFSVVVLSYNKLLKNLTK